MNRRSFLSLLVAAPFVPALAKLEPILTPATVDALTLPPGLVPIPGGPMPGRIITYVLGFDADVGFDRLIRPGRIARFVARPQIPFRPRRLLFGTVGNFELLHVASDGSAQLDQSLPGEFFSPNVFAPSLEFHAIEPGAEVVLAVRNVGHEAAHFAASMIGNAYDERPSES